MESLVRIVDKLDLWLRLWLGHADAVLALLHLPQTFLHRLVLLVFIDLCVLRFHILGCPCYPSPEDIGLDSQQLRVAGGLDLPLRHKIIRAAQNLGTVLRVSEVPNDRAALVDLDHMKVRVGRVAGEVCDASTPSPPRLRRRHPPSFSARSPAS